MTVGEAITELQTNRDVEMVFYLYVVDERRHLVGVVVAAAAAARLAGDAAQADHDGGSDQRARRHGPGGSGAAGRAPTTCWRFRSSTRRTSWSAIITVDDVIDVIKDEATEDIYRLAGVARRRARVHARAGVAAQAPAVARDQPGDRVSGRGGRRAVRGHDRC